jgi:hypothetical protein
MPSESNGEGRLGMALEFKVIVDTSVKSENDPKALEKKMNEMSRAGWSLAHVTSVSEGGGSDNIMNVSRIYLFWQREAQAALR